MPVVAEPGSRPPCWSTPPAPTSPASRRVERDGTPLADLFEPCRGRRAASASRRSPCASCAAGASRATRRSAALLVAAGGRPRRHVHVMSRDLVRDPAPRGWLEPPLPDGVRLTAVDRPAIDLAPACRAAYPPDHPDYPEMREARAARGRAGGDHVRAGCSGPLLRCSGLAVGEDGAVLGAVLVNGSAGRAAVRRALDLAGLPPPGRPGVGGALLRRALAIATRDGLPGGRPRGDARATRRAQRLRGAGLRRPARGRSTSSSETHEGPAGAGPSRTRS